MLTDGVVSFVPTVTAPAYIYIPVSLPVIVPLLTIVEPLELLFQIAEVPDLIVQFVTSTTCVPKLHNADALVPTIVAFEILASPYIAKDLCEPVKLPPVIVALTPSAVYPAQPELYSPLSPTNVPPLIFKVPAKTLNASAVAVILAVPVAFTVPPVTVIFPFLLVALLTIAL